MVSIFLSATFTREVVRVHPIPPCAAAQTMQETSPRTVGSEPSARGIPVSTRLRIYALLPGSASQPWPSSIRGRDHDGAIGRRDNPQGLGIQWFPVAQS